jgi:hypothetical protein
MPVKIPPLLLDEVRNRRVVLFAGAGISIGALGGVSGGSIFRALIGEIGRSYPSYDGAGRAFEDVCDEYAVITDKTNLVVKLAGMIPQDRIPSSAHLAAVKTFRFIVTTNWDNLFEKAYDTTGQRYQVLSRNEDAPSFNYDQHNLLKIHGSAHQPLTLVATSEDYEAYADTRRDILAHVERLLYNNMVLFVGYGLRDGHLNRLLTQIRLRRGPWTQRAFAVGMYDDVRIELLRARNIGVLSCTADEILPQLAAAAGQ